MSDSSELAETRTAPAECSGVVRGRRRPATTKKLYSRPFAAVKRTSFQSLEEQKQSCVSLGNETRQVSEVLDNWSVKKPVLEVDQYKFCEECQCHRPPRAHHCKKCERCILRRDHHCNWLGVCIGYYNYKYFILLLYYQTIFLVLIVSETLQQLLKGNGRSKMTLVAFTLFFAPELLLVASLCTVHTLLLCRNMTSIERIKRPNHVNSAEM